MAKCTFWYRLTRVVPDKVQRAVKWLYVCCMQTVNVLFIIYHMHCLAHLSLTLFFFVMQKLKQCFKVYFLSDGLLLSAKLLWQFSDGGILEMHTFIICPIAIA